MHAMFVRSWPFVLAVVWCGVPCLLVVGWMGWYCRVLEVGIGHPLSRRLLGVDSRNENPLVDRDGDELAVGMKELIQPTNVTCIIDL